MRLIAKMGVIHSVLAILLVIDFIINGKRSFFVGLPTARVGQPTRDTYNQFYVYQINSQSICTFFTVKSRNLMSRLEARGGEFHDGCPLVRGPLLGEDGRVADEGKVDSGEGDEVGLVLVQVHVQLTAEPQAGSDGGHHLGHRNGMIVFSSRVKQ